MIDPFRSIRDDLENPAKIGYPNDQERKIVSASQKLFVDEIKLSDTQKYDN
jgi:hypothetical protein